MVCIRYRSRDAFLPCRVRDVVRFWRSWPVTLPFLGRNSLLDLPVFALILWGAWENIQISRHQHLEDTFVPAETLLDAGDQLHCQVHNPDSTPALRTIYLTNRFLFQAKKVSFRVLPINTLCRKSHSQSLQRQLIPARSGSSWNTNPMNGCSRIRPQTNFSNGSDSGTVRIMPLFRWKAYIQMNTWRNHTMKILKLFKNIFALQPSALHCLAWCLPGGNSAFRRPDRRRK